MVKNRLATALVTTMTVITLNLIAHGIAHAIDTNIVPATMCQRWGGVSNAPRNDMIYSQFGSIQNNNSTHRLVVVCPIIKDPDKSSLLNSVSINFRDRNGDLDITGQQKCRLRYNNRFGTSGVHSSEIRSTGVGSVSTGIWNFNINTEHSTFQGSYTLVCSIPAKALDGDRSSIGSIIINEN